MTKLYKLTDENGKTRGGEANELQWGAGVTHTAKGEGSRLCTDEVIHAYENPLVAVLLNPIHAGVKNPRLWEAEGEIIAREGEYKCGVKTLTTVREIPLPEITLEQRVKFGLLCALEVCKEESFVRWAQAWLSGEDRSENSAVDMANKAECTAWASGIAAEAAINLVAAWAASGAGWAAAHMVAVVEEVKTAENMTMESVARTATRSGTLNIARLIERALT